MKENNIKCFEKLDISDNELPMHVGEEGIVINGTKYKNVKIIKNEDLYYVVSDKAVLTFTCTALCNARCNFCYNGITFTPDSGGFIDVEHKNLK